MLTLGQTVAKTNVIATMLKPKAQSLFAPGSITNITGLVNESELTVVELKTLENLQHNSLGIWNSATPDNPSAVAEGGTANFRVQKLMQFGEYTKANRNDEGDLPAQEIKVKADIAYRPVAKYELETLDLPGMGFGTRESFVSFIASGITKSMTALLDAYYLKLFVDDAITKQKADANTPVLVKPIAGKTWLDFDTDTRNAHYVTISDAKVDVARNITRYNLGADATQFGTMLYQKLTNRLLLAMPKGGNEATAIGRELSGMNGTTVVAGLGEVKDHLFFGQNIAKGTAFSKETDFDFSKVYGVIAHSEAAFLAVQGMVTTSATDPDSGNQKYVTKFNLFSKMIRDGLYRLIVTDDLVAPAKPAK